MERSKEQQIKSTLLVISVWFRWGANPRVIHKLQQHLKETKLKGWLTAVPQLIARIGAKDPGIRASLLNFLKSISNVFPDALIWPLLMAAHTPRSEQEGAAKEVMMHMRALPHARQMVHEVGHVGNPIRSHTSQLTRSVRPNLSAGSSSAQRSASQSAGSIALKRWAS